MLPMEKPEVRPHNESQEFEPNEMWAHPELLNPQDIREIITR